MVADQDHWVIHLMNFVDDFRSHRDPRAIEQPFEQCHERFDALLAATAEYLCKELGLNAPPWLASVSAVKVPWFVSGLESLKAIAFVESPLPFRLRKIFVLENFLSRA
jgi:hypothetical protein